MVAQPAVRSRNYGAVQIRTADLTPQTKYDFKTVQWGYGPGIYANGTWYLRDSLTAGPPDHTITYGTGGYTPVTGDWNN